MGSRTKWRSRDRRAAGSLMGWLLNIPPDVMTARHEIKYRESLHRALQRLTQTHRWLPKPSQRMSEIFEKRVHLNIILHCKTGVRVPELGIRVTQVCQTFSLTGTTGTNHFRLEWNGGSNQHSNPLAAIVASGSGSCTTGSRARRARWRTEPQASRASWTDDGCYQGSGDCPKEIDWTSIAQ